MDEGWCEGTLYGKRGMFPDNFVQIREPVDVNVKMPTGKTIWLSIFSPYTIESVKHEISKTEGIPPEISKTEGIPPHCQQLTFTGRVLEDGRTYCDYDIEDGSTLDLVVRGSKYMY